MRQFVPMTDDLLDDPVRLPGPLVPYRCGMPCWHGLRPPRTPQPAAATTPAESHEEALSALP